MGIVWLASYPKSGNTWLRFLLHGVLYGAAERSLDIARKIPDIHRPLPFDPPGAGERLYAKTHFACSPKHPKIDETEKAVLITRDPRDVLFSALNYRRLSGLRTRQMSDQRYAEKFVAARGDPQFKAMGFGTWSGHIESWRGQSDFPVHTVRYEDLKADTAGQLREVLAFLGIGADGEAIERAVKASSFESMRAMEIREKSKGGKGQTLFVGTDQARQRGTYFMNAGASGRSLGEISAAIEESFGRAFGEDMARHGYGQGS